MKYGTHPIAKLFREFTREELKAMEDGIKATPRDEDITPVVIHDGQIIDGRHTMMICRKLGRTPPIREWSGEGDIYTYVWSRNAGRRHLSPADWAEAWLRFKPHIEASETAKNKAETENPVKSGQPESKTAVDGFRGRVHETPRRASDAEGGRPETALAAARKSFAKAAGVSVSLLQKAERAEAASPGSVSTSRSVRAALAKAESATKTAETEAQAVKDGAGNTITDSDIIAAIQFDGFRKLGVELTGLAKRINAVIASPFGIFVNQSATKAALQNLRRCVMDADITHQCPHCFGDPKARRRCKTCRECGAVPEDVWRRCSDAVVKDAK